MLDQIIEERKKKLEVLRKFKIDPYPSATKRSHFIGSTIADWSKFSVSGKKIFLAGRLRSWRDQGKLIFSDLEDETGRLQLVIKKDLVKNFEIFKANLDVGDFVSAGGRLFKTKKGEKSLEVSGIKILTKCLRPLPSQWYGLKDAEERFRKRYLDFLLNNEAKKKIVFRSVLTFELRKILWQEGFIEVETPILQPLPGGAKAKPFKTHYHVLKEDFYLRVAPELYLKRLLTGGFEKIFEMGKNFRNEGEDREHNPEFTMLELYAAYENYQGLMVFIKKVLLTLAKNLKLKNHPFQGKWQTITFDKLLNKFLGDKADGLSAEEADEVFKKEIRAKIAEPTFIINLPKQISPLAKTNIQDPDLTDRFQLVIGGIELINGFSELNDPLDQRARMEEQEKRWRTGDEEASRLDNDFLEALEYGMPPAAGLGMGIDRLAMLLTNSHSIREVLLFPTMRSKK